MRDLLRKLLIAAVALAVGSALLAGGGAKAQPATGTPRVLVTTVQGAITPVIADHLRDGIERARQEGFDAYLVRLDTPGGLDTSMRRIVQDILASEVPVIVHIAPQGARGASAGAVIAFAAHVAAMAPGTSIGAATPVGGGGGEDLEAKVINDATAYVTSLAELRGRDVDFAADTVREGRSASASEALELGAVDVVATSVDELLQAVDGRTVVVGPAGDREVVLHTAGAITDQHDMGFVRSAQQLLADPAIAFLLLSIGTLGLIYELASPGIGVAGGLGLTFILLGLFGSAVLPVSLVGVLFLLLAMAMFVAEVAAPGVGIAAAGGALSLVLAGLFLFDDAPGLQLSLAVVLPTAIVLFVAVVVAGRFAMRTRTAPSTTTGAGALVGQRAAVRQVRGTAQVFVGGAWWTAVPAEAGGALVDGAEVVVSAVDGLRLVVTDPTSAVGPEPAPTSATSTERETTT